MTSSLRRAVSAGTIFLSFIALILARPHHGVLASSADSLQRGAVVFETKGCERCHAILGVGGDRAPDLANVGQRKTASQIRTQVINGGHGMPPFGKILSKDEVKDVVGFLVSCKTEASPGCRQWMPPEPEQGQNQ
jgi:mono/diheme cytochrome c family protein